MEVKIYHRLNVGAVGFCMQLIASCILCTGLWYTCVRGVLYISAATFQGIPYSFCKSYMVCFVPLVLEIGHCRDFVDSARIYYFLRSSPKQETTRAAVTLLRRCYEPTSIKHP